MIYLSEFATVLLGVALLSLSGRAAADTIVLKNGRRIIALSAFEEGEKVKYLTSAGELSLPESIVDHIERGSSVRTAGSPRADTAILAIAPRDGIERSNHRGRTRGGPRRGDPTGNTLRNWKRAHSAGGRPIRARR